MRRGLAIAVGAGLALMVGALLGGCTRPGVGEGRLTVRGAADVTVIRANGKGASVHGSTTLHRGDGVKIPTGAGMASVVLPGGGTVEMRGGSLVRFDNGPELGAGDLLASGSGHTIIVRSTNSTAVVHGVARLRRDLVFTVGVYQGNVTVTSATRSLAVGAYRQASVAAVGLVPESASPLVLSATDAWDRRELGAAIDLTDQLDGASHGFSASVPSGLAISAGFYRAALTQLPATFTDALLLRGPAAAPPPAGVAIADGQRAPGEILVGAAIVVQGRSTTFDRRWQSVFAFRDAGAAWGLVALDQGVDPHGLLDLLTAAIDRSLLVFSQPQTPAIATAQPPTFIASPPASVPGAPTAKQPATPPPPKVPVKQPVTPPVAVIVPQVPNLPPTPASPVLDPVVQLLNNLVGTLLPAKH
ncbi:MAG TPA: hypothetical protein VNY84_05225 [Acidimicrobiales bacterium]|nr:hypothetical protein [Acidimicrobiales bacterium]